MKQAACQAKAFEKSAGYVHAEAGDVTQIVGC
jgi:hypothetical protein